MINIKLSPNIEVKDLVLIGKGTQGKVYKIGSDRCVKIFKSKKECMDELETLMMAQSDAHFPKLYEYGANYIIREYIDGIELNEYLAKEKLTPHISSKLIGLYEAMVKIGYTRQDAAIFHVFVMPSGELKLIDTAKAIKKRSSIPNLLISGLEDLGYKEIFFDFLKGHRPDLHVKWMNYSKKKYRKKG